MAQAPSYAVPTVSPEMPNQPQASPADFGAQIGAAEENLGNQIDNLGDMLQKHAMWRQQVQNEAAINGGFSDNLKVKAQPTNDFYLLQGKQPEDALPGMITKFDEINKTILDGMPNQKSRNDLQQQLQRQDSYTISQMSRHAATQARQYADNQASAKIDILKQSAAQPDDEFNHNLDQIHSAISDRAKVQGWSPEQEQLQWQNDRSDAWRMRIAIRAQTDPQAGYDLYQNNKDQLNTQDQLALEKSLAGPLMGKRAKELADKYIGGATPNGPASTDLKGVLGMRESSNNYGEENTLGFAGRYQFGAPRLETLGLYAPGPGEDLKNWNVSGKNAEGKWSGQFSIPGFPEVKTLQQFLASPGAQEKAWDVHDAKMEQEIKANGLDKFEGQTVQGTLITHDGLKAMMHLGGTQGTINALTGHGGRDDYGTTVLSYARLGLSAQANPRSAAAFGNQEISNGLTQNTTPEQFQQILQSAQHDAQMISPNNAVFEQQVTHDLSSAFNTIQSMHRAQETANTNAVLDAIVPKGPGQAVPTSVSQLDEKTQELFYNLQPKSRESILGALTRNARSVGQGGHKGTDQDFNKFALYREQLAADGPSPDLANKIVADPDLSDTNRRALINQATSTKPQTPTRFDMGPAMQVANPALRALGIGIGKDANGNALDANKYQTFKNRYTDIVKSLTEKNRGVLPGDDVLNRYVNMMLKDVVVSGDPGYNFRLGIPYVGGMHVPGTGSGPVISQAFNMAIDQIPPEVRDRYQAAAKKAGIKLDDEMMIERWIVDPKRLELDKQQ